MIVIMYVLFELRERFIFGVASLDMASDKWTGDLLPVIKASRFASLLPTKGGGSRDGFSVTYQFGNGAILRFMTPGGDDQARAGFTSRFVGITELEGFDEVGGKSREGDKIRQLERRRKAYGSRGRTMGESTVGLETSRTWQEVTNGTNSRIALPCPHCGDWVTPEREHFVGWQEAKNEIEAERLASLCCPECGALWSNEQRIAANDRAVLVHRGQKVLPDGSIDGPAPETNTFGFRWSVVNSIVVPDRISTVGGLEWSAQRSRENGEDDKAASQETDLRQSEWALPKLPSESDARSLDAIKIAARTTALGKGLVPADTIVTTVGVDVGRYVCHWTAMAHRPHGTPHVFDYGEQEVAQETMAEEAAIKNALRSLRDEVLKRGWKREGGGADVACSLSLFDIGWGQYRRAVIQFCQESGPTFLPTDGFGRDQRSGRVKRETGARVLDKGEGFAWIRGEDRSEWLEADANVAKRALHARLTTPVGKPGGMTLFAPPQPRFHGRFCRHMVAEKQEEVASRRGGFMIVFVELSRNNHYLDSTSMALLGGHILGQDVTEENEPAAEVAPSSPSPGAAHRQLAGPSWMYRYKGKY
jgi:hypothetical protein